MKAKQTYLKGKSVFTVSLLVIGITILTVYLTGENYNRTISANLYLSLSIIGTVLFIFMTYGLYKGIELKDNYPKYRDFKTGSFFAQSGTAPDVPLIDSGDGFGGIILSILVWIGVTILIFVGLILLEAIFWLSIFILLSMLYWEFFRALRLVFSKSPDTKGKIEFSALYAICYTCLYLGWIFGIVYSAEILR